MQIDLAPAQGTYLPTLDGWRAVAIVLVIASHSQHTAASYGATPTMLGILSWGRIGVDLFFALSGFLICTRLLDEHHRQGSISLSRFYIRRCFRILPVYFSYLLLVLALSTMGAIKIERWDLLSCCLFLRNYVAGGPYTGHFWSLAVEEHFYLFWPLFLVCCGVRTATRIVPAIAVLIAVWRAFDARYSFFASMLPDTGVLFRTDTRIDAILWGCYAAMLFPMLSKFFTCGLVPYAISALITTAIASSVPGLPTLLAMSFPLLIASTVSAPESNLGKFLEFRTVRFIGRLSYGLYVWHMLFFVAPSNSTPWVITIVQTFPVNLIATMAVSLLSYYLIERPLIALGHRITISPGMPPGRN